jgi:hypothetical protein
MFDHEPFHEALKRFFPRMNAEAPTAKSFRKLLAPARAFAFIRPPYAIPRIRISPNRNAPSILLA